MSEPAPADAVAFPERPTPAPPPDTRPGWPVPADAGSSGGFTGAEPIPPPVSVPPPEIEGYTILGLLGQGGMGVVYKALQVAADRVVALKMILGGFVDADARARFRNEAHAVARLQHPHVVQVFEVGEYEGRPFFSLEFCPGGSLEARLSAAPLPPAEAARLVETLARAMHAAHQQHIIHRDLKPANVLLAAGGAPKIADFGLAKVEANMPRGHDAAGKTMPGAVMGSPPYMAPEQAAGRTEAVGPLVDVYALGAILYECLTGRPPFKAASAVDTLIQVIHDEPVAPRQLQPKTPRDLETICLKCLRKDPGRRYAGAEELAEDLRRFQVGEPIRARPVGSLERLGLWARRRPGVASLTAGVVASLLMGTTVSTCLAVAAYRWATTADANATDAHVKTIQAQDAEQQARDEARHTEAALARGLLRPLGHGDGPVNDVELDALWEAAQSTNNRVRLLFIEDALGTPAKARQLRNRRDLALHAAVGLDRARRDVVEKMLLDKLRDDRSPPGLRVDCALIGTALGDVGPEFAAGAARVLAEAVPATTAPGELAEEARALHALSGKLGADESARVAAVAALALVAAVDKDPPERYDLAPALGQVAEGLTPADAARVAHAFLDAMNKAEYAMKQSADADGLLAILDRLNPNDRAAAATEAARVLATAMTKLIDEALAPKKDEVFAGSGRVDLMELVGLASGFRRLVDKLDPKERNELAAPVERRIADAMGKIQEWLQFSQLGDALEDLPSALEPDAAAAAFRTILADDSEAGKSKRISGGKALEALASRTAPGGGGAVADAIEGGLTGLFSAFDVLRCTGAMKSSLENMGREEAARHAARFADRVVLAMGVMGEAEYLVPLTGALLDLAPRLEPAKAGRYLALAARALADALPKTSKPYELSMLAAAVATLAPKRDREDAARDASAAARLLSTAIDKADDPDLLAALAQALRAVADALEPEDAAARASAAARKIRDALAHSSKAGSLLNLSRALQRLSDELAPGEASECATAAAYALTDALARATEQSEVTDLARAYQAVACCLGPDDARLAARLLTEAMSRTTYNDYHSQVAGALETICSRDDPSAVRAREVLAALVVAAAAAPDTRCLVLSEMAPKLRPPPRFTTDELVDMLKWPTCVGSAQVVVLERLGDQCGRPFRGLWDFVEWAEMNRPDLDLKSPPRAPRP